MIRSIVSHLVTWLNAFPPKGGVSKTLSPRNIITGSKLDYNKHCLIELGQYAQVVEEPDPTNSIKECTTGAIALGCAHNAQGSYRTWREIPITTDIINRVEALAQDEPDQLIFHDRSGDIITHIDNYDKMAGVGPDIAGVDNDNDIDNDSDSDSDDDDDNDDDDGELEFPPDTEQNNNNDTNINDQDQLQQQQ